MAARRLLAHVGVRAGAIVLFLPLLTAFAKCQSFPAYQDLLDFNLVPDQIFGICPSSFVSLDSIGDIVGGTEYGGSLNVGTLYEITKAGHQEILHEYGSTVLDIQGNVVKDGGGPGPVSFDSSGNLYGTTTDGGLYGGGTVWKLNMAGLYTVLHSFGGSIKVSNGVTVSDGSYPVGQVAIDSQGNLYGTAQWGGAYPFDTLGGGIIWEITKEGVYRDLHDFGGTVENSAGKVGSDGVNPVGRVTFDHQGNLYGVAEYGGPNQVKAGSIDYAGMVWEITKAGTYKDLHDFGGKVLDVAGKVATDGRYPTGGVTFDPSGNMYGTTINGGPFGDGSQIGDGMIWEITASGTYRDLHDFGGEITNASGLEGPDGKFGSSTVFIDNYGNLFGTTQSGGPNFDSTTLGDGILWEISRGGLFQDLHDFGASITSATGVRGSDGASPSGVAMDSAGNLYGTTFVGGLAKGAYDGFGLVWKLWSGVDGFQGVSLSADAVIGGSGLTGTATLPGFANNAAYTVSLSSDLEGLSIPDSVTIPAQSSSATFAIKTAPVAQNAFATITAVHGTVTKTITLKVEAAVLTGFTVLPATVVGSSSESVTGTLALNGLPPAQGATIKLTSSNPSVVSVPFTAFIHSGHQSVSFPITHSKVSSSQLVTITATFGNATRTFKVEVTP